MCTTHVLLEKTNRGGRIVDFFSIGGFLGHAIDSSKSFCCTIDTRYEILELDSITRETSPNLQGVGRRVLRWSTVLLLKMVRILLSMLCTTEIPQLTIAIPPFFCSTKPFRRSYSSRRPLHSFPQNEQQGSKKGTIENCPIFIYILQFIHDGGITNTKMNATVGGTGKKAAKSSSIHLNFMS